MDGGMFRAVGPFIYALLIVAAVSVPFALWKLVDVGIWLFEHITIQ